MVVESFGRLSLPTGASLRRARLEDLELLQKWEVAYFGEDQFSRTELRYLLARSNTLTWILSSGAAPAGASTVVNRKHSATARLYSIVVVSEYRGRGLGTLLLEASEQFALANGCKQMALEVRVNNHRAIHLYQQRGYVIAERVPGYYADSTDGWRMIKPLARPRPGVTASSGASNSQG